MKTVGVKKRFKLCLVLISFFSLFLTVGIALTNINYNSSWFGGNASEQDKYSITLNSNNKVTSAGDHVQKTGLNNDVTFTYSGVASSTSGHATLSSGGTIVNKTQITSISAITATFSGSGQLKARLAYVPKEAKFSEYFTLASGSRVETGSNPYYLELKADGGSVTLTSVVYEFTCVENEAAETQEEKGSYQITFKSNGGSSDGSTDLTPTTFFGEVVSGSSYISSVETTKLFAGISGLKFASNSNEGILVINFNSSYVKYDIKTIDVVTTQYGTRTPDVFVTVNDSSSHTTIDPETSGGSVSVNGTLTKLRIESSGSNKNRQFYLNSLTLNYDISTEPGEPENPTAYEVGFSASDANKDTYTTNSIFASANAIKVDSLKSDGSSETVDSSHYSYVVLNSLSQEIDPTVKFPEPGTYTLVVSYSTYIPQEIILHVGEYVYITDVSASMTTTTFTTSSVLSEHLSNNLTANLEFSDGSSSQSLTYEELPGNNIAIKLLTPKGFTYDITKPFGTAGTWTLKVYNLLDENMYYDISLTINAIPVASISLDTTSETLYPNGQLQLVATVGPSDATNPAIDWSSSNEDVATVNDQGLVTAVAIGGATITAAAVDGSNVYGTCTITVVAQPAEPTWEEVTNASTLTTGDVILITYESGTTLKELNGIATYGTNKVGEAVDFTGTPSGAYPLTIVSGEGNNYALKNGSYYLYWGSGNTLDKTSTITTSSSWTFSGVSTIKNVSDTTRVIQYNKNNPRFACYTSTQQAPTLYRQTNASPVSPVYPTAISLSGTESSISIGGTSQLTVGYTPIDTNVKNVTYTSNNESVATVSNSGLITGIAQGTTTITATAEAASGTVSANFSITVTPISVTSVSLSSNSETIKVGKTVSLVATVYPTNATNKNVTWTSSSTGVATVSSAGVVTGVAAGTATITVRTTDGNKTATCTVVVQESSSGGEETYSITYSDLPAAYSTDSTIYTADSGIKFQAYNCAGGYSSKMQFRASSGYLQSTEELELQSITINDPEQNELTVYGSNSAGSFSTQISGTDNVYDLSGYTYFKVARTASGVAYCSSITVLTGTPTPTDPTSIILSSTSAELTPGGTKQLSVSYVPSNANQNKDVSWTSSNTNVATVTSDGLVSAKTTASAGQTATITARLSKLTSIYATCTITITEQANDDHTVLIYICGSNLESDYASSNEGLATGDISEILSVTGQPDDVNIVIETGGANKWSSTYGINSSKLERWHVDNRSLVKDASLNYASMGLTSTLQSFIEYGLKNYPADRTGLILWNHGGAMRGVCYDEKKDDDSLLTNEVSSAVSGALSNCGMSGQKLEWIGYDACLMQVQDIASINSDYFNYMIASEESESGYGWDYDTWVDDLYAKKTTPTILKAVVDGFIKENGGTSSTNNDQTLSYLDLSYMSAYKTAWENMSAQLYNKITTNNKSSFNTLVKSAKYYADSDYTYYGIFDAKDFINKLASNSTFNPGSTYTNAVLTAHANLVAYSSCGKGAGNSNGLCLFWSCSSNCAKGTYYTSSMTKFTNWRNIVTTYGS